MSERSDQKEPEKADPALTRMPTWRWFLMVLVVAVAYGVSVFLDVHDGMSTRRAATGSAIPAVAIIVFLLVRFRRRGEKP